MVHDGLQLGMLLPRQVKLPTLGRPNGVFGMCFKRVKTLRRFSKQTVRLLCLLQGRISLGQGDGNGFLPEVWVVLTDLLQQV